MKGFFGSMTGRVFITLLLGTVTSAVVTQLLAENERQRVIEDYRDLHALDRSEQLITATETVPPSARMAYLIAANRPGIRLEEIKEDLPLLPKPSEFTLQLAARMGRSYQLESIAARPAACDEPRVQPSMFGPTAGIWHGVCESINVRLRDGEQLRLQVLPPPSPAFAHKTDYRMIIALFLVSIAALAYLVARMTTRPLIQLAQAAKDLGNDINHPPLSLTGASEIRQASAAFNAMQARIRQYIFQRTQMLAAITHDLQTPLTRMRLRLEKVSDHDLQARLIDDLSAMQEMVREGPGPGAQHGHHGAHAAAGSRFAARQRVQRRHRRWPAGRRRGPRAHGADGPADGAAALPGQPDRQRRQVRPGGAPDRRRPWRRGAHLHPR